MGSDNGRKRHSGDAILAVFTGFDAKFYLFSSEKEDVCMRIRKDSSQYPSNACTGSRQVHTRAFYPSLPTSYLYSSFPP